jgi:glutathione S-transferase
MKLYYSPGTCSLAPHILLRETELPFSLERVDIGTHRLADGTDYYTVNPRGQVPFLELDDGTHLSEGSVIAQYIADRAKATRLMPVAGSMERYRAMEWQNYVSSEIHKAFTPLFNSAIDPKSKQVLAAKLRGKYEWLDGQLARQPFLGGDEPNAADFYLFVVTIWAPSVGLDLSDLANVQRFQNAMTGRTSVRSAMVAEGLRAAA